MLTSCNDWQTLEEIIAATVAELERYPYCEADKQQLGTESASRWSNQGVELGAGMGTHPQGLSQ